MDLSCYVIADCFPCQPTRIYVSGHRRKTHTRLMIYGTAVGHFLCRPWNSKPGEPFFSEEPTREAWAHQQSEIPIAHKWIPLWHLRVAPHEESMCRGGGGQKALLGKTLVTHEPWFLFFPRWHTHSNPSFYFLVISQLWFTYAKTSSKNK